MNKITIGKTTDGHDLELDVNKLIDSRMVVQGNSGSGKSGLLRLICERVGDKVPFIILDPEGEFSTLREKVDAVLIGPDGDIPTDLRSAALLARKLIELNVSGIIDLYELTPQRRKEYVKLFLDALIALPRELWQPRLVIIDEAHKFCPEKGTGEAVSTESVINLMSLGRKRGFSGILATQRFSKLHNDSIAETNNVFIGRTWLDNDQKRAGSYLGLSNADRQMLREIKPREFYAFGPALSISGVTMFKTETVATTHPVAGERHKLTAPKASDVISHIIGQIEGLPELAEQEKKDIAGLQIEIADLKRQLAERPTVPEPVVEQVQVEVPVMTPDTINRAIQLADGLSQGIVDLLGDIEEKLTEFRTVGSEIRKSVEIVTASSATQKDPVAQFGSSFEAAKQATPLRKSETMTEKALSSVKQSTFEPDNMAMQAIPKISINPAQQRILDALAWYQTIGNNNPSLTQIGAVALIDPKGGYFSNLVGPLSSAGLVVRQSGAMQLTVDGSQYAHLPQETPTLFIYHNSLRDRILKMKKGSSRTVDMLNVLIEQKGAGVTVEEMGEAVAIDPKGGYFSNTFGPLSTLGIAKRSSGTITPTKILFPDGLK